MRRLHATLHTIPIRLRHVWLPRLIAHVGGQSLVEYALILSLAVIVVVAILSVTGGTLKTQWWDKLSSILPG